MMKSILLNTKPVSINKRYTIARGRNILSTEYRRAKEALQWEVKSQWEGDPLEDKDLELNIVVYYYKRKTDIDAYLKILLDAMEKIVYVNDSQISGLHVYYEKDKEERVEISILWGLKYLTATVIW